MLLGARDLLFIEKLIKLPLIHELQKKLKREGGESWNLMIPSVVRSSYCFSIAQSIARGPLTSLSAMKTQRGRAQWYLELWEIFPLSFKGMWHWVCFHISLLILIPGFDLNTLQSSQLHEFSLGGVCWCFGFGFFPFFSLISLESHGSSHVLLWQMLLTGTPNQR